MLTKNPVGKTTFWEKIKRTAYWVIPGVILVSIFFAIDIHRLAQILKQANLWFMVLGVLIFPCIVLIGAYRWKILLTNYLKHKTPFWFVIRTYWIGLAIGKFFPASLTWDVYRVVAAGKKFGDYTLQAIAVLLEKIAAVIVAAFLILCTGPFIYKFIQGDGILAPMKDLFGQFFSKRISIHYGLMVSAIFLLMIPAGLLILRYLKKININWKRDLIFPLFKPDVFAPLLLSSTSIHIGTAIANYYFFYSLNSPLPFIIHFFLMPIFAVLMLLPVTFAGFGLREGSFIIFYGLFGIPMETALIVSFMNLTANLINSAIGGIIMLTSTDDPL